MSKQIDWIARAFLACAVVAACELAFGQDDYENVVLGRAASSDFDQNVPSPLGSLQTPGNSSSLNAAPAPDATIESSAVAASSSTNAAGASEALRKHRQGDRERPGAGFRFDRKIAGRAGNRRGNGSQRARGRRAAV